MTTVIHDRRQAHASYRDGLAPGLIAFAEAHHHDSVIANICAGAGIENLLIARSLRNGRLTCVDQDQHALTRLRELANKYAYPLSCEIADAQGPISALEHADHIGCSFGLHHLSDAVEASRSWAMQSPATHLTTLDWGPEKATPTVSSDWSLTEAREFDFVAYGVGHRENGIPTTITLRNWRRR